MPSAVVPKDRPSRTPLPPFANRGVVTPLTLPHASLSRFSFDYLTCSVSPEQEAHALTETTFVEPGKAGRGFKKSELRQLLGCDVWRRVSPVQISKRLGEDYACWEASGPVALDLAQRFRGCGHVEPSRIDVAFDFACDPDDLPEGLCSEAGSWAPHVQATHPRRSFGISGQGGVNTCYLGAPTSTLRLRVYRKDRQDPASHPTPVMRVELVVRQPASPWVWNCWNLWGLDGLRAVATRHVLDLTGWAPTSDRCELPEPGKTAPQKAVQQLLTWAQQNAGVLHDLREAGYPLDELADLGKPHHRMAVSRSRARVKLHLAYGPAEALRSVRQALRRIRQQAADVVAGVAAGFLLTFPLVFADPD